MSEWTRRGGGEAMHTWGLKVRGGVCRSGGGGGTEWTRVGDGGEAVGTEPAYMCVCGVEEWDGPHNNAASPFEPNKGTEVRKGKGQCGGRCDVLVMMMRGGLTLTSSSSAWHHGQLKKERKKERTKETTKKTRVRQ